MNKRIMLLAMMILLFSQTFNIQKALCNDPEKTFLQIVDEEYDRFRKQGDDLFKRGEYEKALKKYIACLEVPNYAKDTYALSKVSICRKAVSLLNDISKGRNDENVISKMEELLKINPEDSFVKETARDYWIRKGNEKFEIGALIDSKNAFEKAGGFRNDEQIKSLIKKVEDQIENGGIEMKKGSKGLGLKILTGIIGAGAGIFALKINADWDTKISALSTAKVGGDYNTYQLAYTDANKAKSSEGLRNACVGIAIAAVATEVYLIIRKPKPTEPKISFSPTNNTLGLSLNYKF